MKAIVISFAIILASVSALPNLQVEKAIRSGQERLVTDQIVSVIEDISQAIIDAGLDPLIIENNEIDYALPVPSIFNVRGFLRGLLFQGASNIVIDRMNLNILTMRLTWNIRLPQILLNVVDSGVHANYFGKDFEASYSGRLAINRIVSTGDVRVSVGIISGISVRSIALTVDLQGIESQLNLKIQGVDLSDYVNTYLGQTMPNTLKEFSGDINDLVTIVAKEVIETIL
ncbi:hypothetical protein MSG28_000625 [Choristoneura fumiferana]|uniref:Uncharacterized protein n=1 Tax=Choristoneura fumiferana TaxID=7141 RepID=A0ACC0K1L5_CHOFU|nr:hypothetical protein MSG28_000625 [Choristoneura fumiferana]